MTTTKATRREAAQARQKAYEALTIQERIQLAQSRPGSSKRELARLVKVAGK